MSDTHDDESAVVEPIITTKTATRTKTAADPSTQTRRQPPYNVIILNDEEHTFDYVIDLLTKLFRHPFETARVLTWQIHTTGRAVVYTTHKEKAELKCEQVLAWGPDPRMSISKGSLGCYIEPAPTD